MKQNGPRAGGQTFSSTLAGSVMPRVQRDAVERGVDPPKVERSTMTTYDLKQTGQLIEAMRSTRLFAPGCPYWGCGGVRSLASGAHPKVASERLGHSRIGITLDL